MDFQVRFLKYMAFVFFFFCVGEFYVCMNEFFYYAHRIHQKIKSIKAKKKADAFGNNEITPVDKPDRVKFLGKTICCLPILFFGFLISFIIAYAPENGYTDEYTYVLFAFLAFGIITSLLTVVIGLLLCCYSHLRKNRQNDEELHNKFGPQTLSSTEM